MGTYCVCILELTTSQNLQTFFGETKGDIDEFFILIMKYVDSYKIFITQWTSVLPKIKGEKGPMDFNATECKTCMTLCQTPCGNNL